MMPAPQKPRLYDTAKDSAAPSPTDVSDACFDFDGLAAYLNLSRRTLSRLAAGGLLPSADLTLTGRNQRRWMRSTITRWLASKPKLPGRGKGGRP
jgi:hypothetical protein